MRGAAHSGQMTRFRLFAWLVALLALAAAQDEAETPADDKASSKKESSKLAPTVKYLGLHSFLHGGVGSPDKMPKALLLLGSADADTPDWYTSAAMGFKEGKKKSVSFAVVKEDGEKTAHRFGFPKTEELPRAGVLVVCLPDGDGGGRFARYQGSLIAGGGGAVRAVKTFVKDVTNDAIDDAELQPLPPFPPPDIPRKQASVSLIELTYDNLPTHCFGGAKSVCVLALLPQGTTSCPEPLSDLARRNRNDPVQFAWLKNAHKQEEFVAGFGLTLDALPKLVAVKPGKRSRFAVLEAAGDDALELKAMGSFVDRILGGDMQFKPLKPLPELEPPYLQGGGDDEEAAEEKDEM